MREKQGSILPMGKGTLFLSSFREQSCLQWKQMCHAVKNKLLRSLRSFVLRGTYAASVQQRCLFPCGTGGKVHLYLQDSTVALVIDAAAASSNLLPRSSSSAPAAATARGAGGSLWYVCLRGTLFAAEAPSSPLYFLVLVNWVAAPCPLSLWQCVSHPSEELGDISRSFCGICIIPIWHWALEIAPEVHLGSFHPDPRT